VPQPGRRCHDQPAVSGVLLVSWAKLDDKAHQHPKFLGLDPGAVALYFFSISYSASVESDGFVPRQQVPILAAVFGVGQSRAFRLADMLIERRLWDETGPEGYKIREALGLGFWIHGFLERNPSHAELEDRRRKEADKKRRQRSHPHGSPQGTAPGTPDGSPAAPDPTRPDPRKEEREPSPSVDAISNGDGSGNSPVREFFEAYSREYETRVGEKPRIMRNGTATIIGQVLRQYPIERVKSLLHVFFTADDPFFAQAGFTINTFVGCLPQLVALETGVAKTDAARRQQQTDAEHDKRAAHVLGYDTVEGYRAARARGRA
jgi:hypothetical protein